MRIDTAKCDYLGRFFSLRRVSGTIGHEPGAGELGDDARPFGDPVDRLAYDFADDARREIPLRQDFSFRVFTAAPGHDQHALLRLAEKDFIRRHSAFTGWNFGHVDADADIAAL